MYVISILNELLPVSKREMSGKREHYKEIVVIHYIIQNNRTEKSNLKRDSLVKVMSLVLTGFPSFCVSCLDSRFL